MQKCRSTIVYDVLLTDPSNIHEAIAMGLTDNPAGSLLNKAIIKEGPMIVAIIDQSAFYAMYELVEDPEEPVIPEV